MTQLSGHSHHHLGGNGGPHCPEHPLRNLLHRAGSVDLEALLEPDALGVEVHHPVHLRLAAVVGRGLVRGEVETATVIHRQLEESRVDINRFDYDQVIGF